MLDFLKLHGTAGRIPQLNSCVQENVSDPLKKQCLCDILLHIYISLLCSLGVQVSPSVFWQGLQEQLFCYKSCPSPQISTGCTYIQPKNTRVPQRCFSVSQSYAEQNHLNERISWTFCLVFFFFFIDSIEYMLPWRSSFSPVAPVAGTRHSFSIHPRGGMSVSPEAE